MKKLTAFVCLLLFSRLAAGSDPSFEKSDSIPVASFRIIFGLKDQAPRSWSGRVVPVKDQIIEVEADHFRDHQYEAKGWKNGIVSIKLGDSKFPND
jgi:hypothetical protein